MQIVLRGDIKCMIVKMKFERGNKGFREKMKGTKAEEENERLRTEIKRCR